MNLFKNGNYKFLILYFLFLMVLGYAYYPAISGHYLYHDDFLYWSRRLADFIGAFDADGPQAGVFAAPGS